MTTKHHNLSRRQALVGIGITGATALVPIAGASAAKAQPDRSAWNAAVASLEATSAEYERISSLHNEAYEAAESTCPRQDEFFRRFGLGCDIDRDRNFNRARFAILLERSHGRTYVSDEEAQQITADAYRVVDDFETYSARRDAAFAEYDRLEKLHDKALDARQEAREALLATPAPDAAAVLFKLDMVVDEMTEADAEDSDSVLAIRKDARRLFGRA